MTAVRLSYGETIESGLRRFKKATQKDGILADARRHEHFVSPSVARRKKSHAARARLNK
jgi:small subunit ribosomal protein S21